MQKNTVNPKNKIKKTGGDMDPKKINRSMRDIEAMLNIAFNEKNLVLAQKNTIRLLSLMNYLIKKLELHESYFLVMKNEVASLQMEVDKWEKEFLTEVAKKGNVYHLLKTRIDEAFK